MPHIRVILVEPKNEGNIGAVARAMRNFDADELVLVSPCTIGDEARRRAMHGISILESAHIVDSLRAAMQGADFVVGTSSIRTESEKRFARIAIPPRELAQKVGSLRGTVGLVFGREDEGLHKEELLGCDVLVAIPASTEYAALNLSHAAAILLYELFREPTATKGTRPASGLEKEKLYEAFATLMRATEYPEYKRARTKVMFRRLMGRAVPSKWEFHALMGVFRRAAKRIERLEADG